MDAPVRDGSDEQAAYVYEMMEKMAHYQADFVSYPKDMELYLDHRKLEQSMMKRNYDYCRNVIDLCVHPLAHGVSFDTVMESVGTYVGMALVNPELRKQCNDHVVSALYPGIERLGRSAENVVDRLHATTARRVSFLEQVTGHKLPFGVGDKIRSMPYNFETQNERMMDLHDRAMRTRNYGRVPLTPETAALMRLNFAMQYYYAVREPGADLTAAREQYFAAQETLSKLAEADKIPEEEINRNARLLVTQFSSVPGHENLSVMFEDVVYGDVRRSDFHEEERPDGTRERVWTGECQTAGGERFEDWFRVREPMSQADMREYVTDYYKDVYAECESFADVLRVFQTPEFRQSGEIFKRMMRDDASAMASSSAKTLSEDEILVDAQERAGKWWAEEHPECQAEMDATFARWREDAAREQAQRFGFDFEPGGEDDDYGFA